VPNPQHAILTNLTKYQWYTHFSRTSGADLGVIKAALRDLRSAGGEVGVTTPVNVCILFGPSLLDEMTDDVPEDFQPYPGYESSDGKVAKATQEELLTWIHSDEKDLCWEAQFNFRNAVAGHMDVARETPTFIYRNSLDLTGFIDGTGNPVPDDQYDRAIVPDGRPGAGGSFCIAQRWVHDLDYSTASPSKIRRTPSAAPRRTPPGSRSRSRVHISAMSSCARARPQTRASPSGGKWCDGPRPMPSTTGPSGCTSWAFAGNRRPCASAWKRSTGSTASRETHSPITRRRPRAPSTSRLPPRPSTRCSPSDLTSSGLNGRS
jgi:hypothetical protein